jgi:hypothetical protein
MKSCLFWNITVYTWAAPNTPSLPEIASGRYVCFSQETMTA